MGDPLHDVRALGQSLWFDNIHRTFIRSGGLKKLIEEDGIQGVTSNPAIFEKAILETGGYDADIARLAQVPGLDAVGLYERLAVKDIQDACDVLRGVYEDTQARDGYVSLEVSPVAAHDTEATILEARRLWGAIGRDNAMIKIPATAAGIPAIEACVAEGININVTLLFSLEKYERVAEAFLSGVERLAASGRELGRVASVASFFVSRIDSWVDPLLDAKVRATTDDAERARVAGLLGKVAIANAKLAHQRYKALFSSARWKKLASGGARTQRLLWASTRTKNPAYPDVYYVESLIGPDTVNTLPPATLKAFRDHGRAALTLEQDVDEAKATMSALAEAGISMSAVTDAVLSEAVRLFVEPFQRLVSAVETRRLDAAGPEGRPTHGP
jgi:transaldolase/glucose-6-phosphate isomerase